MGRNRRIKGKKFNKRLLLLLLLIPAIFLFFNLKAIDDWWNFGMGVIKYQHHAVEPVDCTIAPYDNLCNMAQLQTELRGVYIKEKIREYGYDYYEIKGPAHPDITVTINASEGEPYTVFSAHYDKKIEDAEMAMDNTAGVYALLAVLYKLRIMSHMNNAVFVFSGEEETGFGGAEAFIQYAEHNNLSIKEYVVIDSIGRGRTYAGSIGQGSGFYLRIPFGKEYSYAPYSWNENSWFSPKPYFYSDNGIVMKLKSIAKQNNIPFKVYDKMVAWGEDEAYQKTGIPTARIYGDDFTYYFKKIHTYDDKIEYLDMKSLDETVQLLFSYAVTDQNLGSIAWKFGCQKDCGVSDVDGNGVVDLNDLVIVGRGFD